jgi:hypothetical protein
VRHRNNFCGAYFLRAPQNTFLPIMVFLVVARGGQASGVRRGRAGGKEEEGVVEPPRTREGRGQGEAIEEVKEGADGAW